MHLAYMGCPKKKVILIEMAKYIICRLEWDDPPKHLLLPSTINSPQCQEFMVSRIFSVVTIFLSSLMDEFTLMEVF